ncbi:MAG: hypothetical protein HF976_05835 [ANME-2 cluster archaeon]|nr:hypothetical protein [ANME-2 cluster archaeon]
MKLKIIIKGKKTHNIGYRVLLATKALTFGVNNFNTFNTVIDGLQTVITMIEADDEKIEEFKAFIHTTSPKSAEVESINVEEYKNSIPPIERFMQAFQMEQLGKSIPILSEMRDKQDSMLDKQDSMLDKQDSIVKLQKETIITIKAEEEKTTDVISNRIAQDVAELRHEIDHVKSILSKVVDKVGISE